MERHYKFAGVAVTVCIPEEWSYSDDGVLAPFRSEQDADAHVFRFEMTDRLPEPEGEAEAVLPGMRIYRRGEGYARYIGSVSDSWEHAYMYVALGRREHRVQVMQTGAGRIGVKVVLNALAAEHLVPESNGFLFHCSYIAHNGKAILFTAPSGTGKSTQAELWREFRGAEIINGDRAAVRLVGETIMAEGIPFAGSSQYCKNRSLPVAAIVYLGQAPATSIRRLRGYAAFSKIWEGVSVNAWDRRDLELVSGVVRRAAEDVPVYHLMCTPDGSAVSALENAMRKQGDV